MQAVNFLKGLALAVALLATGCATNKPAGQGTAMPTTKKSPSVSDVSGNASATGGDHKKVKFKARKSAIAAKLAALTPADKAAAEKLGWPLEKVAELEAKQIYQMTEPEVDQYLRYVHEAEPELANRIVRIGRHNIGQPYEIYLLGEFPFETYDPQPLYCIDKSDCVVFAEHTYAMALGADWPSFFAMLQRIRYKDGQIGVVSRNHYTESDWDRNNTWLVKDVTQELAGDAAVPFKVSVDRSKFLKGRYNLESDIPKVEFTDYYVPFDKVKDIEAKLEPGTFVNVIRTKGGGCWAGHTGLITKSADGTTNFMHSTTPTVKEQPIQEYIAGHRARDAKKPENAQLAGFKFLRLEKDPLANLRAIDGPDAPRVTSPLGTLSPNVKPISAVAKP